MEAGNLIRKILDMQYVLPVNRGRTALELALRALPQNEKNEVVLPAYVCKAVLEAVKRAGFEPVFADVGADLNVTAETVKAAITDKTKCVIVAHLFGKAAPIEKIEALLKGTQIMLVDDAAQAFGARRAGRLIGTFGDFSIVSCGPGKPLVGSAGGFLLTNNYELYQRALAISVPFEKTMLVVRRILSFWLWRRLRQYTLPIRVLLSNVLPIDDEYHRSGTMSNLDGAIALSQLHALQQNALSRRENAKIVLSTLGILAHHSIADTSAESIIVKVVVILPKEGPTVDDVIRVFATAGVECRKGDVPLHFSGLPITESLWGHVLCIPIERTLTSTVHMKLQKALNPQGLTKNDAMRCVEVEG